MPPACPGDGYDYCYKKQPHTPPLFPVPGGFAAGDWEKGKRKVALYVATSVRLPRASRGHPPHSEPAPAQPAPFLQHCKFLLNEDTGIAIPCAVRRTLIASLKKACASIATTWPTRSACPTACRFSPAAIFEAMVSGPTVCSSMNALRCPGTLRSTADRKSVV